MKFINILTGAEVTPTEWQLQLKAGDHYVIESDAGSVYGVIQKPYGRRSNGLFLVTAHSQHCPAGETGMMHLCDPTRTLTAAEFNAAAASNWAP